MQGFPEFKYILCSYLSNTTCRGLRKEAGI